MTADGLTRAVRLQLRLGRLLPLGGPGDGAWIAEAAAWTVLRKEAADVPGVRLGALRIEAAAGPEEAQEPAVPAPPGAMTPGPLRVTAEFAAGAEEPLPDAAARLRAALAAAATRRLGLTVTEVDLRVESLLDDTAESAAPVRPSEGPDPESALPRPGDDDESRVAAAVLTVPGVTRLTGTLGGLGRPVHIEERREDAALTRRHVRVELAVRADHRAVEVAREVRATAGEALRDRPTVAVLVTAVE
ncbi:nucleopolyhedrovirus P10 family protein [Streptomyces sp. NPDC005423]|uniref:nucleopolyhedrovirus P10 family protein n=1 Tax=Streptomyces sp. NPDC005423 TaxID=3155343 RepID=UPI0033B31135